MNLLAALALGSLRAYAHVAPTQRGGYRLARFARRFVPRQRWNDRFVTPGGTLSLDLATYPDCCMAVGLYELDSLRLLRRLLQPGHHFVDCGANIGYFTLVAANCVGAAGRVDAFEPDPLNRARLQANLAANNAPQSVRVHPIALSDVDGNATLYHPADMVHNHGEASLFAPLGVATTPHTVPLARLDQQLDHTPNLIKMDIEGAELSALKGMTRLLQDPSPPTFIIEHNPPAAQAASHRPGDLLRLLQQHQPRYRAHWVGWRLSEIPSPEVIDAIHPQGNILYKI